VAPNPLLRKLCCAPGALAQDRLRDVRKALRTLWWKPRKSMLFRAKSPFLAIFHYGMLFALSVFHEQHNASQPD
jgi:hypothetical protein